MGNTDREIDRLKDKMQQDSTNSNKVKGVSRRKLADSCFKAVSAGRFHKVKFLLDNGVAAHTRNDDGQSLLVAALYIDDEDKRRRMCTYLISRGVPCVGLDNKGRDVLCWACILGYPQQVQQIADAAMGNVDLHRQDKEGMTPLHHATKQGHIEVVRILIKMMDKFRLSVDVQDVHGLTPYLYARRLGHYDVADVLVKEGNASTHQFDSQHYHNADDWAVIGAEERRKREVDMQQQKMALYKIRGRLPPVVKIMTIRKNTTVPRINLSAEGDQQQSTSSIFYKEESFNDFNHVQHVGLTSRSIDTALALLNPHRATSLDALATPMSRSKKLRPITSNSILTEEQEEEDQEDIKEEFKEEDDENPAVMASIPNIMDILSDQSCPSYRGPATRSRTVRRPLHIPPHLQRRKETSTLAMVLSTKPQRNSSGQTSDSKKTHIPWR